MLDEQRLAHKLDTLLFTILELFNTRIACLSIIQTGQDLEKLAVHFCVGALELQNAAQYGHNLTLLMLKSYLAAGGTDNESYTSTCSAV